MKALCWNGPGRVGVGTVPDPTVRNEQDIIVKVRQSATCGSDLPLVAGQIPLAHAGEIIGHEFVGEVVEVGPEVRRHRVGDRVVACPFVSCGRCWFCEHDLPACCDNGNSGALAAEDTWGGAASGCLGFPEAMGGFAGSHAEYVRVPFADQNAFGVPEGVSDDRALFAADAVSTGWMGAERSQVGAGDVVAVWGAGAVGLAAARAASLLGAERVIVIDRYQYRLDLATEWAGAETIDYHETDVHGELRERTGGRGPDVCIEAVGMQPHNSGPQLLYDRAKKQIRFSTERPSPVEQAVLACRKGGNVFVLGLFTRPVERFPLDAVMHKSLTVRSAQQHGQRYVPMLLERMARDEIRAERLATHRMPLEEAPKGYELFRDRADQCVRAVFTP
ncbi:alcohol dehydrogenase catalytic domain-containing protein [Micromonosporaceae bacterium DT55]|uniref:alcohol dehydrogenase catalytic domain-containing protein n=1 Tax=Melissospora conviva TaxID=3388432 RepID=UPI003C26BCDB